MTVKEDKSIYKGRMAVVCLSILLYIFSLTQPAFSVAQDSTRDEWPGYMVLLVGWLGVGQGGQFAYLANILVFLTWIFFYKNTKGYFFTGIVALLFALSFLLFDSVVVGESGSASSIAGYGIGYWLWLTSISVMSISVTLSRFTSFLNKKG